MREIEATNGRKRLYLKPGECALLASEKGGPRKIIGSVVGTTIGVSAATRLATGKETEIDAEIKRLGLTDKGNPE